MARSVALPWRFWFTFTLDSNLMEFFAECFDGLPVPIDLRGLRKVVSWDMYRARVASIFDAKRLKFAIGDAPYEFLFHVAL